MNPDNNENKPDGSKEDEKGASSTDNKGGTEVAELDKKVSLLTEAVNKISDFFTGQKKTDSATKNPPPTDPATPPVPPASAGNSGQDESNKELLNRFAEQEKELKELKAEREREKKEEYEKKIQTAIKDAKKTTYIPTDDPESEKTLRKQLEADFEGTLKMIKNHKKVDVGAEKVTDADRIKQIIKEEAWAM